MRFKLRPIFKDISLTFIAEAIVLVGFIFIYRLIAKNFGPEGVGEYSLVRRVVGFLQPVLLLGAGVGIPRYIAMARDKEQRSSYIRAGGSAVSIFTFTFLIFINLFKGCFAKIFFGSIEHTNLVLPFSLFLAGLTLHTLIFSYFRGRLFIKTFNFLRIINFILIPVAILIFLKGISMEKLITLIGIATFMIAFIFLLFFLKEFFIHIKKKQFKDSLRELLHYGLPRVPGDFVFAGLLSLGPIFAAHFSSLREVGYLSVSQSLLTTAGVVAAPLYLILLPKVSRLIAQKREEEIKENLNYLIGAILQCSIFICIQLIIFADTIIKYWLGSEFLGAVPVMRIVFFSILFYLFYEVEGAILEAAKVKPINMLNASISLGIFLVLSGILLFLIKPFSPIISLTVAFTSGMLCLGILTHLSIRKIYPAKIKRDLNYLWIGGGINILLGGITIWAKPFVTSKLYYLIIFEILMGIFYLTVLYLLKMEWIRQIPKMIYNKVK